MLSLPEVPSTFAVAIMSKNWDHGAHTSFTGNSNSNNNNDNIPTNNPYATYSMLNSSNVTFPYATAGSGGRSLFPTKLRQILEDAEREGNQNIVSWLPHGRAFRVFKPQEFASKIVGRYFNHGQYRSFTRQLYHYGFGKVDTGEDMGAFYHPQFLRDQPALANFIGRRKDSNKGKKNDEQQSMEDSEKSIGNSKPKSSGYSDNTDFTGFQMLESPFQALVNETNVRLDYNDANNDRPKERGFGSLLQQLSSEDQEAMIKHFKTDAGEASVSINDNNNSQSLSFDEEAGIGLVFGDGNEADEGIYKASAHISQSVSINQHFSSSSRQQDWFSSIGDFFDDNSFEDDMFGVDFEPRPIEEMILLSYNLSRPSKQR